LTIWRQLCLAEDYSPQRFVSSWGPVKYDKFRMEKITGDGLFQGAMPLGFFSPAKKNFFATWMKPIYYFTS
jgi:hypothetical protein